MSTTTARPIASVSLDLDNLWSYMKIRGSSNWQDRPTYLPEFVPLVLDVLDELEMKITFFIVGADVEDSRNVPYLRRIADAGHEIGNHSYHHEPWLHLYSRAELETELHRAEEAIGEATGRSPRGFRGPGFSWSSDLIEVLAEREYAYDASTFPTWCGPLARWYYFRTATVGSRQKRRREQLFGSFSDVKRPLKPYRWSGLPGGSELTEIPVTATPGLRTPFHLSYLTYLSGRSETLMSAYLRLCLAACRATGTAPSYLLHPLDLLSSDDAPELSFFPGMQFSRERKRAIFTQVLRSIRDRFEVVTMSGHAERAEKRAPARLLRRTPSTTRRVPPVVPRPVNAGLQNAKVARRADVHGVPSV